MYCMYRLWKYVCKYVSWLCMYACSLCRLWKQAICMQAMYVCRLCRQALYVCKLALISLNRDKLALNDAEEILNRYSQQWKKQGGLDWFSKCVGKREGETQRPFLSPCVCVCVSEWVSEGKMLDVPWISSYHEVLLSVKTKNFINLVNKSIKFNIQELH